MRFFVGLHQPSDAAHVDAAFVSVNRLKTRKSDFKVGDWIMDSGAFSTILTHGGYPDPPSEYAAHIRRWSRCGNLMAAVAQDYMCEAHMLEITGMSIADHQRLTIERYDQLLGCDTAGVYILPVLQGYAPEEYARHVRDESIKRKAVEAIDTDIAKLDEEADGLTQRETLLVGETHARRNALEHVDAIPR